jgi:molybdopterin-guanine dinucleotide biosynthesis protein A
MNEVTLAILAGGEGSRMGKPKGELVVGGRPILEYLLERFAWTGPTLLVTAPGREHPPGWERFGAEVVDRVPKQGPMRAILTALENSVTDRVITATVDMPVIGRPQLDWLVQRLSMRPRAMGMMLSRPDGAKERIEPFPSIFRAGAKEHIIARLEHRLLSVKGLTLHEAFDLTPPCDEWDNSVWTNLNRPEDLEAFTRLSRSSRAGR